MASKKIIISWIIILLMVLSTLGYIIGSSSSDTEMTYNGYEFSMINNKYYTNVNGVKLQTYFLPNSLESIEIPQEVVDKLRNTKMFYITYNESNQIAQVGSYFQFTMSNTLWNIKKIAPVIGMTHENDYNLPTITCANASVQSPVVYILDSTKTEIVIENNCILIKAQSTRDALSLADRVIYSVLGIMN